MWLVTSSYGKTFIVFFVCVGLTPWDVYYTIAKKDQLTLEQSRQHLLDELLWLLARPKARTIIIATNKHAREVLDSIGVMYTAKEAAQ